MAKSSLGLRIGMSVGEPIEEDGDIYGAVVVQASRIADLGDAGDILVSDAIRQMLLGKSFLFEVEGEHELKEFERASESVEGRNRTPIDPTRPGPDVSSALTKTKTGLSG